KSPLESNTPRPFGTPPSTRGEFLRQVPSKEWNSSSKSPLERGFRGVLALKRGVLMTNYRFKNE
ncbi:MAG: hypothetical protein ACREOB_03090, partial [Thermodesulfobacteriota bacterium]